jgi:hypothetical protein
MHYIHYINYISYTNYTHYLQVCVWQDKRTLIAQSVDKLGDQSRPAAMRAVWLSYISRAYPEDNAADAGPVMGEGILVVQD